MSEREKVVGALIAYAVLAVVAVLSSISWNFYQGGKLEEGIKLSAVWLSVLTPALTAWLSWRILNVQQASAVEIEHLKSELAANQKQSDYVRGLHADRLAAYSSAQAVVLRRAYLLVFEPESSGIHSDVDIGQRLIMAEEALMRPLRKYLGVLDEATMKKIYSVRNMLVAYPGKSAAQLKVFKNEFFNATEMARRYVKADKLAYRRGLISSVLEEPTAAETEEQ